MGGALCLRQRTGRGETDQNSGRQGGELVKKDLLLCVAVQRSYVLLHGAGLFRRLFGNRGQAGGSRRSILWFVVHADRIFWVDLGLRLKEESRITSRNIVYCVARSDLKGGNF